MMPHRHGVDSCSLRFCKKCRQLDLGESRSSTPNVQWNQLVASHQLWANVYAFGADGDDGDSNDGDNGDGDNGDGDNSDDDDVRDGDHRTRST